jgi:hypothetical protein
MPKNPLPGGVRGGFEKYKISYYQQYMKRNEFLIKLARYFLYLLMASIVFALGNKVVTTVDCSSCPGKGKCNGKTDCSKY